MPMLSAKDEVARTWGRATKFQLAGRHRLGVLHAAVVALVATGVFSAVAVWDSHVHKFSQQDVDEKVASATRDLKDKLDKASGALSEVAASPNENRLRQLLQEA